MKLLSVIMGMAFSSMLLAESVSSVMVGGDEHLDACTTLAAIKGSKEIVKVYSMPDQTSEVADKLKAGTKFMLCDSSKEGWSGIVYSGDDEPYCGVTSPIKVRQAYKGECKSGWIKNTHIEVLAG